MTTNLHLFLREIQKCGSTLLETGKSTKQQVRFVRNTMGLRHYQPDEQMLETISTSTIKHVRCSFDIRTFITFSQPTTIRRSER
jgi:hypothetical protein